MHEKRADGEREPRIVEGGDASAPERDESVNDELEQEERPTTDRP